ncbi:MAG TPA: Hpt domain-containing protein [Vicinamibacterales bacterium]|nr:Hpt domain-containing protein [Vicinamibacterales bacterium]
MDEHAVLDQAVVEGLRRLTPPGEPDVLAEVLKLFLEEVPPRIARLRNALAAGNIQDVQRAAHSLKGSAGNIGARRLFEVCRQLDEISRSGELTTAPWLVEALGLEFGKVASEIHRLIGE